MPPPSKKPSQRSRRRDLQSARERLRHTHCPPAATAPSRNTVRHRELTSGVAVSSTSFSAASAAAGESGRHCDRQYRGFRQRDGGEGQFALRGTFAALAADDSQRGRRRRWPPSWLTCPRVRTSQKSEAWTIVQLTCRQKRDVRRRRRIGWRRARRPRRVPPREPRRSTPRRRSLSDSWSLTLLSCRRRRRGARSRPESRSRTIS